MIYLTDGRTLGIPLAWFPRLAYGTPEERAAVELWDDGEVLAWPILDEHLPLTALVAGSPSAESPRSLARWKETMNRYRAGKAVPPWLQPPLPLPEWWDEGVEDESEK